MGTRNLTLVTDAKLVTNVQLRPSTTEPGRDEKAINTTFAEAVLEAFRSLTPADTAIDAVVSLVAAALPPAYNTASTVEVDVDTALSFWEERGQIGFEGFKQLITV